MNYKLYLSLLLILIGFVAYPKRIVDQSADSGLMVRQIPNSESDVIKYFTMLPIDSDTIYATIFRPANCPRCDGFLNIINKHIKDFTSKSSVLIAVYPDSIASKSYISKHKLESDYYLYDTDESFANFLSFSPGYLHVGYILKINKKTGEIIVGSNADNVSKPFFEDLNIYNEKKDCYEFPGNRTDYKSWDKNSAGILNFMSDYNITIPDSIYSISEIIYQPVFSGKRMLWNDKLAMSVVEFELKDSIMAFKRLVGPDSLEFSKFVNLPNKYYAKLLESDQIKNIPLQPFIIDNNTFGIAYSLPELWLDDQKRLNYRNKPCYLKRSFLDDSYKELVALNYDFEDVYYYPHFNMKSIDNNSIVVGVQRITWPMISDRTEYMNIPESDPFMDDFYDHFPQPTLATYRNCDGLLDKRFGNLPSFAKKTKTGYCFSDMIFDSWDGEVIYGSVYEGSVVIAPFDDFDCQACQNSYEIFHIDEDLFQAPDSTDYYSYNCNALAQPYLNRKIADIRFDSSHIHCLVRNCTDAFERPEYEEYDYVVINRDTHEKQLFKFPANQEKERRLAYGLRRLDNGNVSPYIITFLNDNWMIRTLSADT